MERENSICSLLVTTCLPVEPVGNKAPLISREQVPSSKVGGLSSGYEFCLVFGGFGVVGTVHTDDEDLRMSVYRSGNRRGLAGSADDIDCGEADACPSE